MKTKLLAAMLISLCVLLIGGCTKDRGMGNIRVLLRDAPASYQQVNVEILKVSVHMDGGSWIDLPTNAGIYNLLALQNGIDTAIVNTAQLPAGQITQMRLVLGANNTVMADSVIYNMTVPSGSEAGVKLVGNITVPGNSSIVVLLDFVASESIVPAANGTYILKPVIKVLQ
ncbi:MAG TPA: DUF4382 domain-containing protein [Bacteroidia bacterium]|nr:DUF4382 domain-containing protein [Bacteroidia bacterium]